LRQSAALPAGLAERRQPAAVRTWG